VLQRLIYFGAQVSHRRPGTPRLSGSDIGNRRTQSQQGSIGNERKGTATTVTIPWVLLTIGVTAFTITGTRLAGICTVLTAESFSVARYALPFLQRTITIRMSAALFRHLNSPPFCPAFFPTKSNLCLCIEQWSFYSVALDRSDAEIMPVKGSANSEYSRKND